MYQDRDTTGLSADCSFQTDAAVPVHYINDLEEHIQD